MGRDLADMQKASGYALSMVSGYRSYGYQAKLFKGYVTAQTSTGVDRATAEANTSRSSADPGHSQHQLGLAVDFNSLAQSFAKTSAGRWLNDNAWRYGFVLSYTPEGEARSGYQYEPWHWRWVGHSLSRLMMEQGYLNDAERIPDDYYEAIWAALQGS